MSKSLTFQSLKDSPSSIEAERAVLGGILIDNESWDKIAGILQVDDFYHELNRKIFSCIVDLSNESIPFDFVTINEKVNIGNEPSFLSYLKDIINQTPSAANIVSYANIVRAQSIVRQLMNLSTTLIE